MPEIATTQSAGEVLQSFTPTDEQLRKHDEFRCLLLLLQLATTINYGHPMLPDATYEYKPHESSDNEFHRLSHPRVLNAFAAIAVRIAEIIATTDLVTPQSISIITTVESDSDLAVTRGSQVLFVKNPEVEDKSFDIGNLRCALVQPADPVAFEKIGSWETLCTITADKSFTIVNHLATICSFLNQYAAMVHDSPGLDSLNLKFGKYLVASCWWKMYRRATHWSSVAVIHNLFQCSDGIVQAAFMMHHESCVNILGKKSTNRNDRALVRHLNLYYFGKQPIGQAALFSRFPNILNNLFNLEIACLRAKLYPEKSDKPFTIYHTHTCVEFHKLLLVALVGHAQALTSLEQASVERRASCANHVFMFAMLLFFLTESRAFSLHMAVLANAKLLQLPDIRKLAEVRGFAETWKIAADKFVGNIGTMGDRTAVAEEKADGGDVEDVQAEDAEDEDDEDVDDSAEGRHEFDPMSLAAAYRRRIAMSVTHFGARHILEQYCLKLQGPPPQFKASLIIVDKGKQKAQVTWVRMKEVMDGLGLSLTNARVTVECAMKLCSPGSPLYKRFKALTSSGMVTLGIRPHCEMVLASLLKYGKWVKKKDDLDELLRQANVNHIAVSKLCCPVCWEGLKIFRDDELRGDVFNVRGRHSSLYLMELPPWLPSDALDSLLLRFRELSGQELSKMIENLKGLGPGHKRTPSGDSDAAISINSDPEEELEHGPERDPHLDPDVGWHRDW